MVSVFLVLAMSFEPINVVAVSHCNIGDVIKCPSSQVMCAGNQCCPDGSTCPSANNSYKLCPKGKEVDCTGTGPWYQGIPSVKVFGPSDDVSTYAWNLYHGNMEEQQFSSKRYALLLTRGDHGTAAIPVGYYTSVMGCGEEPVDVTVASVYTLDNGGNACDNFWRHAEGMTTTNPSITWAASQSAP